MEPTERKRRLYEAIPTDPRGWWTGGEVDEFVCAWERLDLPRLTLQDAEGEILYLWCADVDRAAELLGEAASLGMFALRNSDDYEVCIVPADAQAAP